MCEAQREFDARAGPMCPSQLTAPVLHKVLALEALQPLIWGGKGVGSQGDGTAQLLCKGPAEQQQVSACGAARPEVHASCKHERPPAHGCVPAAQVCEIITNQLHMHAMPLTVRATSSANGA